MKARVKETFAGYPTVEIMPDGGNFDGIDGRLEVRFFDIDLDTGKKKYNPVVVGNVSFGGHMTPDAAYQWGECFKAAHLIAIRGTPNELDHAERMEIIRKVFAVVDEYLSATTPATQTAGQQKG